MTSTQLRTATILLTVGLVGLALPVAFFAASRILDTTVDDLGATVEAAVRYGALTGVVVAGLALPVSLWAYRGCPELAPPGRLLTTAAVAVTLLGVASVASFVRGQLDTTGWVGPGYTILAVFLLALMVPVVMGALVLVAAALGSTRAHGLLLGAMGSAVLGVVLALANILGWTGFAGSELIAALALVALVGSPVTLGIVGAWEACAAAGRRRRQVA